MAIRYLILILTTRCNLECRYCYNDTLSTAGDMPEEVMQRGLSLAASGGRAFHLQITGGEPTMAPDLVVKAASLARDTGLCRTMGIQTNATCLRPALLDMFKTYGFQVCVSLDGPPRIQQAQRGKASETLRGLHMLDAAGIPFRVTTVVTQTNAFALGQLVLTLAGFSHIRGIGLDLLVNKGNLEKPNRPKKASRSTLAKGIQDMLAILDAVNMRRAIPIRLRERNRLLSSGNKERSAYCHACRSESIAVRPDGKIFPCGQTSTDQRFCAGTVWEPYLERLNALNDCKPPDAQCGACRLEEICPGDCPSRLHYNRHGNAALICDLYQAIWQYSEELSKTARPGGMP